MVGQNAGHGVTEEFPLLGAPEVVDDEEAAAQQIFAEAGGLGIGEVPPAGLGGVDPGVIEEVLIGEAQMAGVAGVEAGEALDAEGEVVIGGGPIDEPPARARPLREE